jgi:RNA polymerase sigma-70 factor (ECF subfamily)
MDLQNERGCTSEDVAMTEAVRVGDEAAFGAVVERHRGELRAHCYRMLGSFADAEDLVQDTLVKAWRARESFEGRSAVRSWLYRIATNACLDFLESRKQRVSGGTVTSSEAELGTQPHVPWLQPYPDRFVDGSSPDARLVSRQQLELGYVVALQCLPPKQRAALICCDVLDWSAKEAAEVLSLSVPAVNAALQRARESLENAQETGVREPLAATDSEQERSLLARYVKATEEVDVPALAALLREDLRCSMPPDELRTLGRDAAIKTWTEGGFGSPECRDFRCLLTRANGSPAVAVYRRREGETKYAPMALDVLLLEGELVREIMTFDLRGMVDAFGLPREL